jgi:predicted RNA-binding protein
MCLSNVFYIYSNGQQQEVIWDVTHMEAQDGEGLLMGLLGEQQFFQGDIKVVDFMENHSVVLGANINNHK